MATNEQNSTSKDPICGMSVNVKTAQQETRDGETFYFCSDHCRDKFLSAPVGAKPMGKSSGCCG
jgi:Cu+-exporting ATPase